MELRQIRKERGLTLDHVALLAGVNKANISRRGTWASTPQSGLDREDLESLESVAGAAPMKRRTLSIDEAAEVLGIGRNTAYRAAKAGQIPTIRVGGRILVPKAVLYDLIRDTNDVFSPEGDGDG